MRSNIVDIKVVMIHQTEKAYLVESEMTMEPVWLPKSQCEFDASDNTLTLEQTLAEKKGLV